MSSYQDRIEISTSGHRDMHDLTEAGMQIVRDSGIETGLAHVHNVGSTGAVGTIEFEPGLQQDLPDFLDEVIPPDGTYAHEQRWHDGNGHSHVPGHHARPVSHRPGGRRRTGPGHVAADLPPRMRRYRSVKKSWDTITPARSASWFSAHTAEC